MEKKLTDEEIVKAWGICFADDNAGCIQCPYAQKKIDCVVDGRHYKDTLDLIHRWQAENEELKKDVHDMSWIIKIHKYCVGADHCQNSSVREMELQKQVDELKEENRKLVAIGNGFALERNNLREELDELKKSGNGVLLTSLYKKQADDHKRGLSVQRAYWKKKLQQAVKDTAKDILTDAKKWVKEHYKDTVTDSFGERPMIFMEAFGGLLAYLKDKHGVEVE